MKEFCKNHKKELFFVIVYLVYVYVACYVLYTSYHGGFGIYIVSYLHPLPPTWTLYLECAKLYLPGLFMILAWISLINQKKGLYVVFAIIVFANLYFIRHTHVDFWLGDKTYNNIEYIIVFSIFLVLSLVYFLGKKKQWVYWVSNIAVFFTAINRELKELQELFHYLIESKPNILGWLSYLPHYFLDTFFFDVFRFIKLLSIKNILKMNVSIADLHKVLNSIKERLLSKEYIGWLCENGAMEAVSFSPDYYWYIRVFLLASILILGILLGYQKRNSQKEKIRNIGK